MRQINPLNIPEKDLPLIVLEDNENSLFSKLIKWWANVKWPHGMIMIRQGYFASQGGTYTEVPIEKYMSGGHKLKFRQPIMTKTQKRVFKSCVWADLKRKRKYDILGILGQFLKIKWINNPSKFYCWEAVTRPLRFVGFKIPSRPSNLDRALGRNKIKVYGYYQKEGD